MPLVSVGSIGDFTVRDAVANLYWDTDTITAASSWTSDELQAAGMPNISWRITQYAGAAPATAFIEVATRRATTGPNAGLVWDVALPSFLLVPSVAVQGSMNLAVQAVRVRFVAPGANAANINFQLSASA